jgi:hypothetical protein
MSPHKIPRKPREGAVYSVANDLVMTHPTGCCATDCCSYKAPNPNFVIFILLVIHAVIFWILSGTTDATWETAGMGTVYSLRPPSWDAFQGIATLDDKSWEFNQLTPDGPMYKWGEEFNDTSSAAHDCSRLATRAFNFADFEDSVDGSAGVDSLALLTYLVISIVTFIVITLVDRTKMPICGGSIVWFGVSAAVAAWLPPITTLSIAFTHNYISLSGYILLCATSLVLGHLIWALRRQSPDVLAATLMVGTFTITVGISFSRSSPWFVAFGLISTPLVLWFFYMVESKSCVPCMSQLHKAARGRAAGNPNLVSVEDNVASILTRPRLHNFVIVVIVWLALIGAHLSLAFNTLAIDEYTSVQELPTEAIFLPRLHVVPNHCCPVKGVPDLDTPEFVIGCSLQEWGLAYSGSEMTELLDKPHLSAYREHSPSTVLGILGTMYAVFAISSITTFVVLERVVQIRSHSNSIRWVSQCITGLMQVMLLAVFGSIPMHNDMIALQLFTFATIVFMYFVESGLDLTTNSEYSPVYSSTQKELENGTEVKPENAKLSPLDGYITPMIIGWVGRIGFWTALLHGYALRLSDTDEEYPTNLMVAFVVTLIGSVSLIAIQMTHVCLAKRRKDAKQIVRAMDFSYVVCCVLIMSIFGWSIFAGVA